MTGTAKGGRSGKPSDGPPPPPPPPPAAPPYCDLVCQCQGCIQEPVDSAARFVQWDQNANQGAVFGGTDGDGTTLSVCRANYNGGVHPGKFRGGNCHIGFDNREVVLGAPFEIFVGTGQWGPPRSGLSGAFKGGGEPASAYAGARQLVLCRASHGGGVHPGKVVDGNCNIGWGGREPRIGNFEVFYAR